MADLQWNGSSSAITRIDQQKAFAILIEHVQEAIKRHGNNSPTKFHEYLKKQYNLKVSVDALAKYKKLSTDPSAMHHRKGDSRMIAKMLAILDAIDTELAEKLRQVLLPNSPNTTQPTSLSDTVQNKQIPSSPMRIPREDTKEQVKDDQDGENVYIYCFYVPIKIKIKGDPTDYYPVKLGHTKNHTDRFKDFNTIWGPNLKISEPHHEHLIFLWHGPYKEHENSFRSQLLRNGGFALTSEVAEALARKNGWTGNSKDHGFSEFVLLPQPVIHQLRDSKIEQVEVEVDGKSYILYQIGFLTKALYESDSETEECDAHYLK